MLSRQTIIFSALFAIVFLSSICYAKEIAIVVNKANPIEELSLKDLARIFKADRQYWDGEKIYLLMREQGSWEREIVLKKIYEMSEDELKKFWLGRMFRGEVSSFPAIFGSTTMIKELIKEVEGAISYSDARSLDGELKVIKIEGKLPQDEGYPLRE